METEEIDKEEKKIKPLTRKFLREHFEYIETKTSAELVCKKDVYRWHKGDRLGTVNDNGIATVRYGNKRYQLGLVIYLYFHGILFSDITFEDGDRSNYKKANLSPPIKDSEQLYVTTIDGDETGKNGTRNNFV